MAGHDMGTMVACAYAREHRDEVSHLVFMSAALPSFGLEKLLDFGEPDQGSPHRVFFMWDSAEMFIEGHERQYLTGFFGSEPSDEEAVEELVRAYCRPGRFEAALQYYRILVPARDLQGYTTGGFRFRALLTEGAREVRFERVATG